LLRFPLWTRLSAKRFRSICSLSHVIRSWDVPNRLSSRCGWLVITPRCAAGWHLVLAYGAAPTYRYEVLLRSHRRLLVALRREVRAQLGGCRRTYLPDHETNNHPVGCIQRQGLGLVARRDHRVKKMVDDAPGSGEPVRLARTRSMAPCRRSCSRTPRLVTDVGVLLFVPIGSSIENHPIG
jgi:hypothetical protein